MASVFTLCEQAIGLVRGKRLILSDEERALLENLNYEGLTAAHAQDEAVVCALHFEQVRDKLLMTYAWKFARNISSLSVLNTMINGWKYTAILPEKCVCVLGVMDEDNGGALTEYEILDRRVHMNAANATLIYTSSVVLTNGSDWPPVFVEAFVAYLAASIAPAVTGDVSIVEYCTKLGQQAINEARQLGLISSELTNTLQDDLKARALNLARGQQSISPTSEAAVSGGLDISGRPNYRAQLEEQACNRAYDSVRDRLLELYPWVFAIKTCPITGLDSLPEYYAGHKYQMQLPEDCIKVLGVFDHNKKQPNYEVADGKFFTDWVTINMRLKYTARITDAEKWTGLFKDVFCYELAAEILTASIGDFQGAQKLKEEAQRLIREAERTGAIQYETQISLEEELYNRAINLARGHRTISGTGEGAISQGLDNLGGVNTRTKAEINACMMGKNSVRDRLLELYPWVFARRTYELVGLMNAVNKGWSYCFPLPEDCMKVLEVTSEDRPIDYEEADERIFVNEQYATLRYTTLVSEMEDWPGVFRDVFCYELAAEILTASTGDLQGAQALKENAQLIIREAVKSGAIRYDIKRPVSEEIYNRAIALVRGQRTALPAGDTAIQSDIVGDISYREREAIAVCKRSVNEIRDRLLKTYGWKFARKTAILTQASKVSGWSYAYNVPNDSMKILAVLSGDEAVDYEETDGLVLCNASGTITTRYTKAITSLNELDAVFREVLCYELAQEISEVLTWNAEHIAILEQKKQSLIQNAYRTGAITENTRIPLKEELYNRAIGIARGQRTIGTTSTPSTEQGVDNAGILNDRTQAEIDACKRGSESVSERLLQLYAWKFARKAGTLSTLSADNNPSWKYSYSKPDDYLKVLVVLSGNGEAIDFEETSKSICVNESNPRITYTKKIMDASQWPGSFRDVFCYSLAQEIILSTTHNLEAVQVLEQKVQSLIRDAVKIGEISSDVNIPIEDEIFSRAIKLAHGQRTLSASGNGAVESGLDITGDLNYRPREEIKICKGAYENIRDNLLRLYGWEFAKATAQLTTSEKISGWSYAYTMPSNCIKALAVIVNDEPVEWEISDGKILCNSSGASLRYVRKVTSISEFDAVYREILCCELAKEVITGTAWNAEAITSLDQKIQSLIQKAKQTGIIRAETKIPLKDELCNRAVVLAYGTRTVSPVSDGATLQGQDNAGIIGDRYTESVRAAKKAFETIRNNLQEMFPWVFLRKNAALSSSATISGWTNGYIMPSDCLTVLCVLVSDEPVEFEVSGEKIYCDWENANIRYSAKVETPSEWPAMFTEAFCYKLACEVITSTTNSLETIQILEQKVNAIIEQGYRLGVIKAETRIPLKEELYNRAINLVQGQRAGLSTSVGAVNGGLDHAGILNYRNEKEISACRRAAPSIRDRLLQLYPWVFARKSAELRPILQVSGWEYGYELPDDCMTVLTALSGGEAVDFEISGGILYSNGANVTARYTSRISEIPKWPAMFCDAFVYGLASEIAAATLGATEIISVMEQKLSAIIQDSYKIGLIKTEPRVPAKHILYNRAIGLVKGLKTGSADVLDTRYEDEISACARSFASVRDKLLQLYDWVFARKTETPARLSDGVPGWRYTYALPGDCLKVVSVIAHDKREDYDLERGCMNVSEFNGNIELADYEVAGYELYSNRDAVYVRYTARIEDTEQWAAAFTEAFVVKLAEEVAMNVVEDARIIQMLEAKFAQIIKDAKENRLIRTETGLQRQRDSRRKNVREVPFLDYAGLPTFPCSPMDYCGGYGRSLRGYFLSVA